MHQAVVGKQQNERDERRAVDVIPADPQRRQSEVRRTPITSFDNFDQLGSCARATSGHVFPYDHSRMLKIGDEVLGAGWISLCAATLDTYMDAW